MGVGSSQVIVAFPVHTKPSSIATLARTLHQRGTHSPSHTSSPLVEAYHPFSPLFLAFSSFITVIPDYRLVPDVKFPSGSEDIRDAVLWIVQNPALYKSAEGPQPDVDNLILMGHSAGAVNTAIIMLYPPLLAVTPYLRGHIKAVILSGALYHFDIPSIPPTVLDHYFGEGAEKEPKALLNLLKNAPPTLLKGLPQIIMVESGRDTKAMQASGADFRPLLAERMKEVGGGVGGWTEAPWIVAKEHNHISLNWALMSGEGEEWADELVKTLQKV